MMYSFSLFPRDKTASCVPCIPIIRSFSTSTSLSGDGVVPARPPSFLLLLLATLASQNVLCSCLHETPVLSLWLPGFWSSWLLHSSMGTIHTFLSTLRRDLLLKFSKQPVQKMPYSTLTFGWWFSVTGFSVQYSSFSMLETPLLVIIHLPGWPLRGSKCWFLFMWPSFCFICLFV